ncbi:hypothetical protein NDU88_005424 [Pleurodeles waltl]|uniref:Uncharacterized protein n=1 Tax=Pleurodeles waltl TaxID=8319 RepID=A0AAV7RK43_PLEWA|nr:hypothetical protein NDU88_005424 [Pleurodeles waltl]
MCDPACYGGSVVQLLDALGQQGTAVAKTLTRSVQVDILVLRATNQPEGVPLAIEHVFRAQKLSDQLKDPAVLEGSKRYHLKDPDEVPAEVDRCPGFLQDVFFGL